MTTMHKTAFKLNARSKSLIPGLLLALVMTLPASCVEFTEGKPVRPAT